KAGTPEMKQNKIGYLKVRADASSLLGKRFFDTAMAEASNKDYSDMATMVDDPAKKKEYIFKGAETLREAGKGDLAISSYKALLEMDPNNADALYGLGVAYASTEATFQDAADALQSFVDKAPNDPRAADAKAVIDALRVGNNIKPKAPAARQTRKRG
ncbi:MAG TPA: tetratricopeptide repeat protein, partial [Blastocatellia bacterium]|nr:tetratricopeptide repeat protein [Blastocatellia bacterium]